MRWSTLVLLATLVLAAWTLACGGDDDDSGSGATADDDADDDLDDDASDDDADDDTDDDVDDDTDDDTDDDMDDDADDDTDDDADDDADDDIDYPECADYGTPAQASILDLDTMTELSGLAVSRKNPGVVWAHNDSGDSARLYAFNMDTGTYLGRLRLSGALALDWEDITSGPCGVDWCLYVGDIGDNGNIRPTKSIYIVPEPEVDATVPFVDAASSEWERRTFYYPDGMPDAESLAVHPDETIYLLSKVYGTATLYRLPEPSPNKAVLEAVKIGEYDTTYESVDERATSADIHPDGTRLLVRTLQGAFEWRLPEDATSFDEIIDADRLRVPAQTESQGEAIAYDPATGGYVHASEMGSAGYPPLYRIDCASD